MAKLLTGNNHNTFRVLVVDDSDIIQKALKSFLQELNIEVFTCSNGLEGIQWAVEVKPRLIFLDLMMPNLDGIKMLQVKQVLNEIKNIPVIVISANTNKQNVLSAMESGATKVISKPLQKDMIIKAMKEILMEEWESIAGNYTIDENNLLGLSDEGNGNFNPVFKEQLLKMFINNFSAQKKQITQAIENKDIKLIKSIMHDIKGAAGTVGATIVSETASIIYDRELSSDLDWFFIHVKCEQLFNEVKKIEELTLIRN